MNPSVTVIATDPIFAIHIGVEIGFMVNLFTIATVLSLLVSNYQITLNNKHCTPFDISHLT